MDSPVGSDTSHVTSVSHSWRLFGEKVSRSEIVYFAQLFLCVALIVTCVVMLALHDPNREYWMVVLSSVVGYIMPSPQFYKEKIKGHSVHKGLLESARAEIFI